MKAKELREKNVEELRAMEAQARADLYKSRRELVFRQITNTTGIKQRRHDIARILAVIGEKERGAK